MLTLHVRLVRILIDSFLRFRRTRTRTRTAHQATGEPANPFDLGFGLLLRVLIADLTHLVDVGLHEVVRVPLEQVVDRVVRPILVVPVVRDQDWGALLLIR